MSKPARIPDMTKVGVQHPKARPDCPLCAGRGWVIFPRSAGEYPQFEGKRAIQCCDTCRVFASDIEATKRAHQGGVYARFEYPCILLSDIESVAPMEYVLWAEHPPVPRGIGTPFFTHPDRGCYCREEGRVVSLRRPLPPAKRHRISVMAISSLMRESDSVSGRLTLLRSAARRL